MGGETRDDGELLREFLSTRREAAFEALVRRHHAMVLGVCVRTLGNAHSAEDVAQAVFLILAHRARSLKDQVSISAWLYHVAWKQSQNIRRSAALRRKREREAGELMESSGSREQAWEQISPALDREISALPEKYRAPLILHYLEGLTEEQVAARLESNRGTMSTRLARARELLKSRMVQQGVTVSGAALFALIAERAATAAVSPTVVASTVQAATLIVSGKAFSAGLVSSQAAAIVEGGLRTFLWMKIKLAAAIAAMIAVGGVTAYQSFEPLKAQSWVSRLDTLQPGEWYEAPNTRLNSAGPGVFPPDPLPAGNPSRVIGAWGGGTYDTKRDRLIIHGGGLNDYGGNEIYTFDVNTLAWSRPWGPSRDIPTQPTEIPGLYPQGNPASVATYDGLVYLPIRDKLWRGGGTAYRGNGGGNALAWTFDFNTSTWERKAESHLLGVGVFSDVDPVTGHIFAAADHSILGDYDPSTDKWTVHREIIERGEEMTGVIDPVNRLFIGIGNGFLSHYNIATRKVTNRQPSTGGAAIVNSRGPGLAYDPVLKKIVAWHGGSTSVYSLDVTTWTWTEHKPARTNAVTPPIPSRVVFGRFRYIPSRNLYILVTAVDNNVFFYKLTDGAKR